MSSVDTPLTPQAKGKRSLSSYIGGITLEDYEKDREQILTVTQEDIRALSGIVKAVIDAGNICVIGNESKVEENKGMFKVVKNLIK